jgi:flavin-binding protein dodecin
VSTIESNDIKQHVENVIAFPTCLTEVRKVIATYITSKLVGCSQSLIDTAIENSVNHYKQFVHNANITESVKVSLSEQVVYLLNKSLTKIQRENRKQLLRMLERIIILEIENAALKN